MAKWILSNPEQRRGLRPYLFAIALVAVAVLLRWAASDILRATPYLAFFPACVFAAILGGFWPGMLAFLSSWLCERLLFEGGPLWISLHTPMALGRFVVFLFGGLGVCLLAESRLRSQIRERKADASARHLGAIVESSDDAIIGKMLDGRITSWNAGAERLYGYSAADVLGQSVSILVPDDHPDELADILQRLAAGERIASYETKRKRKDGKVIQISLKVSPILDASGTIVGASSIARDITERKRAEAKLHESEERLSLAIQAADLGTWDWDIAADRLVWSSRCFALFGLSPDTPMTYERFLAALHPADRERIDLAVRTALDRHGEYQVEIRTVWPDGSLHWVISRGKVLYDTSGKAVRMIGAAMDVTERKRSEQALIETEKLASVGRMAATIAHEINNPLAAVMNLLFLISNGPGLPRDVHSHLDLAMRELELVAHITKQTLGFYKESASKPTAVRLPELLDQVLDIYGPKLRNNSVRVERQYGSVCDVYGVGGEIRQIISNLVANSIDAIPQNGTLHLRTTGPVILNGKHPWVALTIADTGSGIAPEHFKHVLEPFFTTKQSVGTGLGLWVTSELVKKNDGKMHIRSQLGKGTVVTIWLPVERRDAVRSIA